MNEKDLLALHGCGPKAVRMPNAELAKRKQAIGSALTEASESFADSLCLLVDCGKRRSTTVRAAPTCSPANCYSAGGSTT